MLGGLGDEDLEQIEKDEQKEATQRKGRSVGLPEIDPDALPSSLVQKYLILGGIGGKVNLTQFGLPTAIAVLFLQLHPLWAAF